MKVSKEVADRIFTILVEDAGANEDYRARFIAYFTEEHDHHEFRFIGSIGFGGKCRMDGMRTQRVWIDCYPEERSPKNDATIARVNARLAALELG